MKHNDLDIDDFLINPEADLDAFEEQDDSDDYNVNDGESFFETVDQNRETTRTLRSMRSNK